MKNTSNRYLIGMLALVCLVFGCQKEEKITESLLKTPQIPENELSDIDLTIKNDFINPYNIDIIYSWKEASVDLNRFLVPPRKASITPALKVIKSVWLDPYTKIGGATFVPNISPREIVLIGNQNFNRSGTATLGIAEAGARVTFFETDNLDLSNADNINRFIGTAQHEYVHILNQTIPFDEQRYGNITPSQYTSQWFNSTITEARELGFISNYARLNVREDFAEMVRIMLSNDNKTYNAIIDAIPIVNARNLIRQKEAIVADYYNSELGIDIYELQAEVAKNTLTISNEE